MMPMADPLEVVAAMSHGLGARLEFANGHAVALAYVGNGWRVSVAASVAGLARSEHALTDTRAVAAEIAARLALTPCRLTSWQAHQVGKLRSERGYYCPICGELDGKPRDHV